MTSRATSYELVVMAASSYDAPGGPTGLRHQPAEQRRTGGVELGVPLDPERGPLLRVLPLDRLDDAVVGPAHRAPARSCVVVRLVVQRAHLRVGDEQSGTHRAGHRRESVCAAGQD